MILVLRGKYKKIFFWILIVMAVIYVILNRKTPMKMLYPKSYKPIVEKYAQIYNMDPNLVFAVIRVESKFDPNAISHQNAIGLMQIMESTGKWAAEEIGIKDFDKSMLKDPEINIQLGCWYLQKLHKEFNYNLELVLAAYNGGSGNVSKWLRDKRYSKSGIQLDHIPFKETHEYVIKVIRDYGRYKSLYE